MHGRPPTNDLALLALGVLCASASPPLIAATAAPALAIAFWRTGAAALVLRAAFGTPLGATGPVEADQARLASNGRSA